MNDNDLWHVALPAICLAENPSRGAEAITRAKPATRKGFITAASSADYADDISELLEKVDDPGMAKLLGPAIAVATG